MPGIVELRQKLHGLIEKAGKGQAEDPRGDEDYDERDNGYQKLEAFLNYNTYQQTYDKWQDDRD